MHDAETRALRRAVVLLLAVSAVRWVWDAAPRSADPEVESVLPELGEAVAEAATEAERRSRPLGPGERIDPNRAPEAELDRLPGIGPATARAIVRAREEGAVFRRAEDLVAVPGVGPATVARMRAHLEVTAPPAGRPRRPGSPRAGVVDLNRAGPDALQALPGIGPALAERIVERRRVGPFASVEELLEVRGIGPATLERLRGRVVVGRSP